MRRLADVRARQIAFLPEQMKHRGQLRETRIGAGAPFEIRGHPGTVRREFVQSAARRRPLLGAETLFHHQRDMVVQHQQVTGSQHPQQIGVRYGSIGGDGAFRPLTTKRSRSSKDGGQGDNQPGDGARKWK